MAAERTVPGDWVVPAENDSTSSENPAVDVSDPEKNVRHCACVVERHDRLQPTTWSVSEQFSSTGSLYMVVRLSSLDQVGIPRTARTSPLPSHAVRPDAVECNVNSRRVLPSSERHHQTREHISMWMKEATIARQKLCTRPTVCSCLGRHR